MAMVRAACCSCSCVGSIVGVLSILLAALFAFPGISTEQMDTATIRAIPSAAMGSDEKALQITVASYNIRLDAAEANPNNHFTKRAARLANFFVEAEPWLCGLQEPFSNQVVCFPRSVKDRCSTNTVSRCLHCSEIGVH